MQEEYGIKLKIITDGLKSSIDKVKGMMHSFKNEVKEETEVKFKIDDTLTLKQLEKFKSDIETKLSELRESAEIGRQMRIIDPKEESNIRKLETGLKMVDDRIAEMGKEAESTKQKMAGISINTNMTSNTIVKGFDKGWRALKKFAFSLLTVRGAYGLIRKAALSYLSQDKQLSNQLQKTWASVGALLAPIIETIVKWIRIGAAYLNYFIKALTGKDLIGKAVKKINKYNKSLAGTAKAAKSVNKELTTMDEVTNLSFDNTSGIDDAAEAFDDFKDIKLDPKVTAILDKWAEALKKLWDKLKPVRDALKGIVDWAIKNPDAVLKILGGTLLISTLGKLTGSKGLLGSLGLDLGTLATIGVVTAGVDLIYNAVTGRHLIDDLKEIIKGFDEIAEIRKANTKKTEGDVETAKEMVDVYKEASNQYEKNEKGISKLNKTMMNHNKNSLKEIDAIKREINIRGYHNSNIKEYVKQIKNVTDGEKLYTDAMFDNWKQGKMNTKDTKNLTQTIKDQIKGYEELARNTKNNDAYQIYQKRVQDLKDKLDELTIEDYTCEIGVETQTAEKKTTNIKDTLFNLGKKIFTTKLEVETKNGEKKTTTLKDMIGNIAKKFTTTLEVSTKTKDAKNKFSTFLTSINSALKLFGGKGVGSVVSSTLTSLLNKIPSYDVGINYVPNDQLAMVHKGEMIVPAKYNPATSGIGTGNAETNALLYELNKNILELSNKPTVLRVNGKDLAQATYSDFKDEGNRLNANKTITIN